MDPHIITARAYEPFIELLRANMQNCGALRIDHADVDAAFVVDTDGEDGDQGHTYTIRWMICFYNSALEKEASSLHGDW